MQFDLLRAFPYPVLRPGIDDYKDSDIQTILEFKQSNDALSVVAEIEIQLSVAEIKSMIEGGDAGYVAVIACRETYFRKTLISNQQKFFETFPVGALRGQVLIYPFIVAIKSISNFRCPWINVEFGTGPFDFPSGAVIAVDTPQAIYIDRDNFKPISSCFVLVPNENMPENEWKVLAQGNKVSIEVHPRLKQRIDAARNSKENRAILINSVYFSAVMQCVAFLKTEPEEYEGFRWAKIFLQRLHDQNIDISNNHEVWVAQQLLRHPISVLNQYFFVEKTE